ERTVVSEGLERARRRVIIKLGVSPSAGVWESFTVLEDERYRFQGVGHFYRIGRLGVLLLFPLNLYNHGAVGKRLAVGWNAVLIGFDNYLVGENRFDSVLRRTRSHILPRFVVPKLGEGDSIRRFKRISVLRCERNTDQYRHHDCNRGYSFDFHFTPFFLSPFVRVRF